MRTLPLACSALLALVLLPAMSAAQDSAIVDQAKFFSAEAVETAQQTIDTLREKHEVDVRVETFESVPAADRERVQAMAPRERGEYFANWLKELAVERQAKGVFILVCRQPSHLRAGVSKELHRRGFTEVHRDTISQRMLAAFKEKEYDRGLEQALAYIRETAESELKAAGAVPVGGRTTEQHRQQPPAAAGRQNNALWGLACLAIGGLVVVMLIFAMVRMLFRSMAGGGTPGYGGAPNPGGYGAGGYGPGYGGGWGGGGGGMFGGLLSGLGGALLGNWMYDRWAGHGGGFGGTPMGPTDTAGGGAIDDNRNYQDFGSSGGDFGDSGGGDFGGGDSGGGDF